MIFTARAREGPFASLPLVIKEYHELEWYIQASADRPILGKRVLHFIAREVEGLRDHPGFELPLAIVYDEERDLIAVPLLRHQKQHLGDFAEELRECLHPEAYVHRMLDVVTQRAMHLADLHRIGLKHGDATLPNIGKISETAFKWRDLDFIGIQDALPRKVAMHSTQLHEQERIWGTDEYLPPELRAGMVDPRTVKYDLDTYAFGVCMGKLFFPEHFSSFATGPYTFVERIKSFKDDTHDSPELRALRRTIARSLARERSYPSLDVLVDHLSAIREGDTAAVIKDEGNRSTWIYATPHEERSAKLTRRAVLSGGIAALGLAGFSSIKIIESWDKRSEAEISAHIENAAYENSPEQLARLLAKTDFAFTVQQRFDRSVRNALRHDFERVYLPRLQGSQQKKVPICTVPQYGTEYATWHDIDIRSVIGRCFDEDDGYFIDAAAQYLQHMSLDVIGDTKDVWQPAVGRYMAILENVPSLRTRYPSHGKVWEQALLKSIYAAVIGRQQYDNESSLFLGAPRDDGTRKWLISTRREDMLVPFICSAISSEYRDSILEPAKLFRTRAPQDAIDAFVSRVAPIGLSDLYLAILRSGVQACRHLVGEDGRTYSLAEMERGRVIRKTQTNDPGASGGESEQPVIAQEHARLMFSLAHRLHVLENGAGSDAEHSRWHSERGKGYPQMLREVDEGIALMRDAEQRMNSYFRSRLQDTGLPGEFLWLHPRYAGRAHPLRHDGLAAARYAMARDMRGSGEGREMMKRMCSHIGFNNGRFEAGLIAENRVFIPTWRGTSNETDMYFRRMQKRRS